MRPTQVSVSRLRVTAPYENERIEVTVELAEGERASDAVEVCRNFIAAQFGEAPTREELSAARALLEKYEGLEVSL